MIGSDNEGPHLGTEGSDTVVGNGPAEPKSVQNVHFVLDNNITAIWNFELLPM